MINYPNCRSSQSSAAAFGIRSSLVRIRRHRLMKALPFLFFIRKCKCSRFPTFARFISLLILEAIAHALVGDMS